METEYPNEKRALYLAGLQKIHTAIVNLDWAHLTQTDTPTLETAWTEVKGHIAHYDYPPNWLKGRHRDTRYSRQDGIILNPDARRRLWGLRKNADESQIKLGERLDVHYSTLARIERGVDKISEELLHKLASHYGVSPAWLLTGEDTTE